MKMLTEPLILISGLVIALFMVMAIRNIRLKDNQVFVLIIPLVLTIAVIGYNFDYAANPNNDLSRFIDDFIKIKRNGLSTKLQYSNQIEIIYTGIAFLASHLNDFHWYPFFTLLFEYGIYTYILTCESREFANQGLGIIISLLYKLSLLPLIMSVSGSRNTIAYTIFALGVYLKEKEKTSELKSWFLILAGGLVHYSVFFAVIVYIISRALRNKQKFVLLIAFWGVLLGIIMNVLSSVSGSVGTFLFEKASFYTIEQNRTNMERVDFMMPCIVLLLIICFVRLYLLKKEYSGLSFFVVTQLCMSAGTAAIVPTFFIRLCYPISMLFPVLYKEIEFDEGLEGRLFHFLLLAIGVLAFIMTRYGWIRELVRIAM